MEHTVDSKTGGMEPSPVARTRETLIRLLRLLAKDMAPPNSTPQGRKKK